VPSAIACVGRVTVRRRAERICPRGAQSGRINSIWTYQVLELRTLMSRTPAASWRSRLRPAPLCWLALLFVGSWLKGRLEATSFGGGSPPVIDAGSAAFGTCVSSKAFVTYKTASGGTKQLSFRQCQRKRLAPSTVGDTFIRRLAETTGVKRSREEACLSFCPSTAGSKAQKLTGGGSHLLSPPPPQPPPPSPPKMCPPSPMPPPPSPPPDGDDLVVVDAAVVEGSLDAAVVEKGTTSKPTTAKPTTFRQTTSRQTTSRLTKGRGNAGEKTTGGGITKRRHAPNGVFSPERIVTEDAYSNPAKWVHVSKVDPPDAVISVPDTIDTDAFLAEWGELLSPLHVDDDSNLPYHHGTVFGEAQTELGWSAIYDGAYVAMWSFGHSQLMSDLRKAPRAVWHILKFTGLLSKDEMLHNIAKGEMGDNIPRDILKWMKTTDAIQSSKTHAKMLIVYSDKQARNILCIVVGSSNFDPLIEKREKGFVSNAASYYIAKRGRLVEAQPTLQRLAKNALDYDSSTARKLFNRFQSRRARHGRARADNIVERERATAKDILAATTPPLTIEWDGDLAMGVQLLDGEGCFLRKLKCFKMYSRGGRSSGSFATQDLPAAITAYLVRFGRMPTLPAALYQTTAPIGVPSNEPVPRTRSHAPKKAARETEKQQKVVCEKALAVESSFSPDHLKGATSSGASILLWLGQMSGALRFCKSIYLTSDVSLQRALSSVTDAAYQLHRVGAAVSPQLLASMRTMVSALKEHMSPFPKSLITAEGCVRRLEKPHETPHVPDWAVLDPALIDKLLGVGAQAEGWRVRLLHRTVPRTRPSNRIFTAPGGTQRFSGVTDALSHRSALGKSGQSSAAKR